MRDADWDIRREGRAWDRDEAMQRYELTPEKVEMVKGKLLWDDEDRVRCSGYFSRTSAPIGRYGLAIQTCGAPQCVVSTLSYQVEAFIDHTQSGVYSTRYG